MPSGLDTYLESEPGLSKIPPQAIDMEEAVIGAMLVDREAVPVALSILTAESFYKEAHGYIFEAIRGLARKSEPVDILTVAQALRQSGRLRVVGGELGLMEISDKVTSAAHTEYHARIVQQKYLSRELIRVSMQATSKAYEDSDDPFESTASYISELNQVIGANTQGGPVAIGDVGQRFISHQLSRDVDAPTGITSGMPKVDSVTGGWQPSDLIILAARPGMGKTALALAWIQSAAEDGTPVLFFSMEMSKEQCFGRMVGRATRIQHKAFRGHMSDEEKERLMSNSASDLLELPIFVDDTPAQNINTMRAKAKLWSAQHPSGLIVADYLQLANAGRDNKVHDVTDVSEGFKAMAKENNVPVIALSQLSRKVEERAVKVPMLSDLRESGGIEQAADAVLFIYRPSYYGLEQDPQGNHVLPNYAELDFAKHRNGALDTLALSFYGEHMDWRDETKYQ